MPVVPETLPTEDVDPSGETKVKVKKTKEILTIESIGRSHGRHTRRHANQHHRRGVQHVQSRYLFISRLTLSTFTPPECIEPLFSC